MIRIGNWWYDRVRLWLLLSPRARARLNQHWFRVEPSSAEGWYALLWEWPSAMQDAVRRYHELHYPRPNI